MRRTNTELILKNSLKFTQSCLKNSNNLSLSSTSEASFSNSKIEEFEKFDTEDCFGGIIKKGQLGWLARGPLFEVFSLKTGQKISSFRFDLNLDFQRCIVTCASEIDEPKLNFSVLVVCMQFGDLPGSVIALCSAQELSKIFRCIEIKEKVTSCHYIRKEITKRTVLQIFNGCLAIGTDNGNVILLDLDLEKCEEALFSSENDEEDIELLPCHMIESTSDFRRLTQHYQHSKQENSHFGIKLNVSNKPTFILSIISIVNILSLAIGLEDGNLVIYDLSEFQVSYEIPPTTSNKSSPLVKLAYVEPADDPRACIYLWAFHEGQKPSAAVMYSIMYNKRIVEDDGICLFEDFASCSLRLTLNVPENGGIPIACQSIFKQAVNDNETTMSLCMLAWKQQNSTGIVLFDMNQWYKEQMPEFGNVNRDNNYLVSFVIKDYSPLDMYINPSTVASFNSIQKAEEHFYANSLSFECVILNSVGCSHFYWPGLQNRALEILKSGGALAILEPTPYFDELIRASLMPQFFNKKYYYRRLSNQSQYSDDDIMNSSNIMDNYNSVFSINDQRNILLSIALEYNRFDLLKECAISWADGSHLGKRPNEGLSLSTLTGWIWQRANTVKKRCNTLCIPLFDHSGLKIDQRSKIELSHLLHQLKLLSDLMDIILKKCRKYIPDNVLNDLLNQYESIRMASEYQEIVLWLLNIGLLPEGLPTSETDDNLRKTWSQDNLVSYPYKILKDFYSSKRKSLGQLNKSSICSRTDSCRILYIDAFIDHECNSTVLRDHWIECGGNGLYPPPSLQAMLRTMLVPNVPIESKYVLFIYLFLDLNKAVDCKIVQNLIKFPAVFKLNASLTKTVQAFWDLDHGQFEIALEELISPFSQDRKLLQWQKELIVEALLTQHQPNLALRALQIPSTSILTLLELKTLLSNDLIADAFHLQRTKNDPELFRQFLTSCLRLGKLGLLRHLAFNEEESRILEEFLKESESLEAGDLHFVYLLQRRKYIEAMSFLDELFHIKQQNHHRLINLETQTLMLSAFSSTMTPASKHLADVYYGIRNKVRPKDLDKIDPAPLSSELFQQDANKLVGGVYHISILSTDQATVYWDENVYRQRNRLFDACNTAFVRPSQLDIPIELGNCKNSVSYPEIYKNTQKRKLRNEDSLNSDDDGDTQYLENPQKRRKFSDINLSSKNRNESSYLNTSLLTKFKEKSNQNDFNHFERVSTNSVSRQNSINKFSNTLNTPIVKSSRIDIRNDYDSADDRAYTPQSILKGINRSSRTPAREYLKRKLNIDGRQTADEEKSIRFDLPKSHSLSRKKSTSSVSLYSKNNDKQIENEERNISNDLIEHRPVSEIKSTLYSGPQKRKPLKGSEKNVLSTSLEDEDYYSVTSSKYISKILDTDVNDENEEDKNLSLRDDVTKHLEEDYPTVLQPEVEYESYSYDRNVDGPKPRKPLRSHTVLLSDNKNDLPIKSYQNRGRSRSKTPERFQLPSRKSERLQVKAKTIGIFESEPSTADLQEKESLKNSSRNQYKSLSQKVLEANAIKVIKEGVANETDIAGNTYVINRSEINEKTEFSFEPHSFTSTKIFESSTPIVSEKRSSIDKKSLSDISDNRSEMFSFNDSANYFSVTEKSEIEVEDEEEEHEETIVNTMKIKTGIYSNLTKTVHATESTTGEVFFEHSTSSKDLEMNQDNDQYISIEHTAGENDIYEDYSKENEGKIESEKELNSLCGSTGESSSDEISVDSSITDSEKEEEMFSINSKKDSDMTKIPADDDIVSISSDDTSGGGGFVDTKNYETDSTSYKDDESEEEEYSENSTKNSSEIESKVFNLLYADLDKEKEQESKKTRDEKDVVSELKENSSKSGSCEILDFKENENEIKIESHDKINQKGCVQHSDDKDKKLQKQISINLGTEEHQSNLLKLKTEIDTTMKPTVIEIENEYESVENNVQTSEVKSVKNIVKVLGLPAQETVETVVQSESLKENVVEKTSIDKFNVQTSEVKSTEQKIEKDSDIDTEVEMLTEKMIEPKEVDKEENETAEVTEKNKTEKIIESVSNESHTENRENTEVKVTASNENEQVGYANKRKLIFENQIDNSESFISKTPEKQVLRVKRARSESIDIERNLFLTESRNSPTPSSLVKAQSVSVDTLTLTPNRILTRRQSALLNSMNEDSILQSPSRSQTPVTPNRVLTRRQSALLDRIEEDSTLVTPKKLLDTMVDSLNEQIPSVPKRTRRSSVTKDDVPITPRNTRSKSVLAEDNYETPKKSQKEIKTKNPVTPIVESSDILDKKKREERAKKVKAKKIESIDSDDEENELKEVLQKENNLVTEMPRKVKKSKSVEPENKRKQDKFDLIKQEGRQKSEGEEIDKVSKKKKAKSVEPENMKEGTKRNEKKKKHESEEIPQETDSGEQVTPEEKNVKTKKEKSVERGSKPRSRRTTPKPGCSKDDDENDKTTDSRMDTGNLKKIAEKDELDENDIKEMTNSQGNKKSSKRRQSQEAIIEESMEESYVLDRKLTRRQKAVVNVKKMAHMASPQITTPEKRSTRSEEKSIVESETESIDSTTSKRSRSSSRAGVRRQTRSSVKDDNDETSSVGSSVSTEKSKDRTGKSKNSRIKNLAVIREEGKSESEDDHDEDSNHPANKRGRARKNK